MELQNAKCNVVLFLLMEMQTSVCIYVLMLNNKIISLIFI